MVIIISRLMTKDSFRCKLQYEEPRVKVINSDGDDNNTLLLTWNKEYIEEEEVPTNHLG
ncbi:MAG: hypothetical protein ACJ71G_11420 [Nitrososphaeraceae archaeon]